MQETTPLYLDWGFWGVVFAGLALLLSQLPPISSWKKKMKIDFDLFSRIALTHKVGNPNIELHTVVRNIGNQPVRIKNILAHITRDGEKITVLPTANFIRDDAEQQNILFTGFTLFPNQEWSHVIQLFKYFGRDEEKEYRALEGALKDEIITKRAQAGTDNNELVEASTENVAPLINFFDQRFIWFSGEYDLEIEIITDVEIANIKKAYKFTLFEYYEAELRKLVEQYKYGDGIYFVSNNTQHVLVEVKEA